MKLRVLLAAAVVVFGFSSSGFAGTVGGAPPTFALSVTSGGGPPIGIDAALTPNGDGTYSASGNEFGTNFNLVFDIDLNPDPSISGSFTLVNLSALTQTFTVSATLGGLLPIPAPTLIGGSFGDVTYTDQNLDSSVTLATSGANPFYRAAIDGVGVRDLGSFTLTAFGGPGIFGTASQQVFGAPIPSDVGPGVTGSIAVQFPGFTLTGGDSVQVPFTFVVVPEPGSGALIFLGVTGIFCAVAAKRASRLS